jgi:hypothetical protein
LSWQTKPENNYSKYARNTAGAARQYPATKADVLLLVETALELDMEPDATGTAGTAQLLRILQTNGGARVTWLSLDISHLFLATP